MLVYVYACVCSHFWFACTYITYCIVHLPTHACFFVSHFGMRVTCAEKPKFSAPAPTSDDVYIHAGSIILRMPPHSLSKSATNDCALPCTVVELDTMHMLNLDLQAQSPAPHHMPTPRSLRSASARVSTFDCSCR